MTSQYCAPPVVGVISPFCDEDALSLLADRTGAEKPLLIGRSDELCRIPATVLARFGRVAVMDETAAVEEGEETDATNLQGLHAKAFVAERGWDTSITIGSGNATRPALLTGRNVELFATLTGKRSNVGSVDDIFGSDGFGRLTRPFVPDELKVDDTALRDAEALVDEARREICRSGLTLRCERADPNGDGGALWKLTLMPSVPLQLPGIGALRVWPITRGDAHGREALEMLRLGRAIDLGAMPLIDLTKFLACRLTDESSECTLLFSTGLIIEGLPSERHGAILRSIVGNRDAFFRYLRLLLSEFGDPFAAAMAAQEGEGHGVWRSAHDDSPLLEEMVRAFCGDGNQLGAIERLIVRLETVETGETSPVPPEFRTLWDTFRIALRAEVDSRVD